MVAQDVLRLMRPRQWTKNIAVFAALVFAVKLGEPLLLGKVALGFVSLNLISSSLYAANDAIDEKRDRQHPIKRDRPVASGAITPAQAFALSGILLISGMTLASFLGFAFFTSVTAYAVLQWGYTLLLKHIAIVDMLVISAGFVIRAVAGAVIIAVPVSPWLVLCTGLLALFLAAAKRRHELLLLREHSDGHRPVLAEYSAELLDSFMVTLSAATITSYALYTFFETNGPDHAMMITIPFVIYGVLRYQLLVMKRGGGGRPEEVLLRDRPILTAVSLWGASVILILYVVPELLG